GRTGPVTNLRAWKSPPRPPEGEPPMCTRPPERRPPSRECPRQSSLRLYCSSLCLLCVVGSSRCGTEVNQVSTFGVIHQRVIFSGSAHVNLLHELRSDAGLHSVSSAIIFRTRYPARSSSSLSPRNSSPRAIRLSLSSIRTFSCSSRDAFEKIRTGSSALFP